MTIEQAKEKLDKAYNLRKKLDKTIVFFEETYKDICVKEMQKFHDIKIGDVCKLDTGDIARLNDVIYTDNVVYMIFHSLSRTLCLQYQVGCSIIKKPTQKDKRMLKQKYSSWGVTLDI